MTLLRRGTTDNKKSDQFTLDDSERATTATLDEQHQPLIASMTSTSPIDPHLETQSLLHPNRLAVDDADAAAGNFALESGALFTSSSAPSSAASSPSRGASAKIARQRKPLLSTSLSLSEASSVSFLPSTVTSSTAMTNKSLVASPPPSCASIESMASINSRVINEGSHPSDLEFFEDLVSEPVLILGVDVSHLSRKWQFIVSATGVFIFSLLYGYLQELISVQLCNRELGLFLAVTQFTGYTILSFFLRTYVYKKRVSHHQKRLAQQKSRRDFRRTLSTASSSDNLLDRGNSSDDLSGLLTSSANASNGVNSGNPANGGSGLLPQTIIPLTLQMVEPKHVPLLLYLGLSLLRAVDLAMTNLAMQYINYPAKTLMKSSRVVFTMLGGVLFARKKYSGTDYLIVLTMVAGLALFMHADSTSSAVFHYAGVIMLTVSLLCDGAISNVSETIMSQYGVGQDEFIFRMYSISLVAIAVAASYRGDLTDGLLWMTQPGTYHETVVGHDSYNPDPSTRSWPVFNKTVVMILFSSMGFFGSSCSAGITKQFGALAMSITSTARKATTLFLSFFLFNNVCTWEHLAGVFVFIMALTAKSLRRSKHGGKHHGSKGKKPRGGFILDTGSPGHDSNLGIASGEDSVPARLERVGSYETILAGAGNSRRRRNAAAPALSSAASTSVATSHAGSLMNDGMGGNSPAHVV
jgi:UAA transporter family